MSLSHCYLIQVLRKNNRLVADAHNGQNIGGGDSCQVIDSYAAQLRHQHMLGFEEATC